MKREKGQVSQIEPMQIDAYLEYDIYNIFTNVNNINGEREREKG